MASNSSKNNGNWKDNNGSDSQSGHSAKYPNSNVIGPTIITGIKPSTKCYDQLIFVSVFVVVDTTDLDDAIDVINRTVQQRCYHLSPEPVRQATSSRDRYRPSKLVPTSPSLCLSPYSPSPETRAPHKFYGKTGIIFLTQNKTWTTQWLPPSGETKMSPSRRLMSPNVQCYW
ncbi:hypothetical protein B0I72DRAFT_131457 [Yarrowia lipolytica]|uniref:Aldehyde dehydrogenase domain-containing protein n=1 Tax=Yarrowia lipolytica TaxID=4952 RepID=A0A371BY02_YARLL|nr:hypothetical protein B0I71DRAFT_143395 [Yarrowia lipolytica]RDW29950.1 hypothetical protein B0I72DRAFT_131457 [Yarrowia lipolytica]RDW44527.1 hypothetical protein B0I74DRAFT_130043 [Yarrowia lipolytica]RDW49765.1 hypothetical protein B0I75DRAFT_131346 [Yarrowia lipolytica]